MLTQKLSISVLVLMTLVVLSALTIVYVKYDSRLKFNQLQQAFKEQDRLGVELGRLQLEQNTWASSGRIEKIAHATIQLQTPTPKQIVYVNVK